MLTLSWPPLVPTLWMPPMGARHCAVTVSVSGGGGTTVTCTVDEVLPKLSETVSVKASTVPGLAPVVMKVGVRLPERGDRRAAKPDASGCAPGMGGGAGGVGSSFWVAPRGSTMLMAAAESGPAPASGAKPPAGEQLTGVGVGLPGHGLS